MAFEDYQVRDEQPIQLGAPLVFNIPQGLNVLRGDIVIDATVTIVNAGAAGTAVGEGGPIDLIRHIKVLASKAAGSRYPNGALVDCSPRSLVRYAVTERSGKLVGELFGSTLGAGVAGVYEIYLSIPVYFADSTNFNEAQTALNMNAADSQGNPIYNAVQVKIDFAATLAEIFSGTGGAMTIAGMARWLDKRIGLTSDTLPLKQQDDIEIIMAPQERLVLRAMPSDGLFTSWLLMPEQGQPALALSDAIVNRLHLEGTTISYSQKWEAIRQAMIDDGFYDPSTTMTGQLFVDFTQGLLANANAAAGLQHWLSVNNPSGAGLDQIRYYTRRYFPLQ
jgi:hypothetical protein